MRICAAALACCLAAACPAMASGSIGCTAPETDGVSAELTIGSLPVLAVVGAAVSAGGDRWSTGQDDAQALSVGQAFETEDSLLVDFTDPNVERVLVEIRLFRAFEDRDAAMAGTLRIPGKGAWPLVCHGP